MSMLNRIRDGFKYLDKNGLKHLMDLIKKHDVHWTGTHAEYEAVKDTIPAYAILHFTDDYDDGYGAPFSRAYINTGAHAYGDVTLASTNVYDALQELCQEWKTKSDTERRAFTCAGMITLRNTDGDTRIPAVAGSYLLTTQRGTDTGTNYFVRVTVWNNPISIYSWASVMVAANLSQLGIFSCDYNYVPSHPYIVGGSPNKAVQINLDELQKRKMFCLQIRRGEGSDYVIFDENYLLLPTPYIFAWIDSGGKRLVMINRDDATTTPPYAPHSVDVGTISTTGVITMPTMWWQLVAW